MDAVVRLLRSAVLVALLHTALGQVGSDGDAVDATTGLPLLDLDMNVTCSIFGGPSCSTELPGLYNSCECVDGSEDRCECVLFYQCDNSTGQYAEDGKGLLDIRKNDGCPQVELRCCKINANPDKRSPPSPHFPLPPPPVAGECGLLNEGGLNSRIVNNEGGEAGFGEFPWMAAILLSGKTPGAPDVFRCGGAIISANVVLTAAHCVKGQAPRRLKVRAGEWDRETTSELYKHQDRGIGKAIIHEDYYGGNYRYDVALLILETPLELGFHIGTICLPEPGDGSSFDGQPCIVAGWGKEKLEDRWPHRYLKKLELPVVPRGQCEEQLRATMLGSDFVLHESFVCAGGEPDKDACKGDGGSPLVCPSLQGNGAEPRYQLAGAVAWGVDCGLARVPGLYANVALVRPWIDQKLSQLIT